MSTSAPDPEVMAAEVRAAETAAQRSVCHLPDDEPTGALATALERRIEISLAAALSTGRVQRLGGADPEVRALEAPWSKRTTRQLSIDIDDVEQATFGERVSAAVDDDLATFTVALDGETPSDTTPPDDETPSAPESRGRSANQAPSTPADASTSEEGTR